MTARRYTQDEYAEIRAAFVEDDSIELTRAEREEAPLYVLDEWVAVVGGLSTIRQANGET